MVRSRALSVLTVSLSLTLLYCACPRFAQAQLSASDPPDVHEAQLETLLPGRQVTVTGRYFASSSGLLQMIGTDVRFRLSGSTRSMPRGQAISVRGKIAIEGGQKVVNVDHLEVLPTEIEQVAASRDKLELRVKETGTRDYQAMHRLAGWAQARGVWYSDRRLLERAADCQAVAFAWDEEDAAAKRDFKRLTQLAARAREAKLDRQTVDRIQHRAIWVELERMAPDDLAGRRRLADELRQLLPGADEPLPRDRQQRAAAYLKNPVANYAPAKLSERAEYHRALWAELTAQALALQGKVPNADFGELARRAAKLIADRPEVARTFKLRDIELQSADPSRLTRGKLVLLEQQFRELDAKEAAGKLVLDWLTSEREKLGVDDAEGRLRLAADYIQLAADPKTAAELYIEAERIVPQLQEAETELGRLGYVKVAGVWQLRSEIPVEVLQEQRRQRSGAIEIGDREADVIRRFRRPDRISRTVSLEGISEQWIYQGPPPLYIFLKRKAKGGDAVVTGIHAP